jgi:hypothetical protein
MNVTVDAVGAIRGWTGQAEAQQIETDDSSLAYQRRGPAVPGKQR